MSKGFIKELRKRNVFKVAFGYLIAAWLVAQVADLVLNSFDAPDWAMRALLIALAVGFPIALIISWAFEMTPQGVVPESRVDRTVRLGQESGRRLDFTILLILSIVIIFMGLERFVFSDRDGGRPEQPALEGDARPGDSLPSSSSSTTPAKRPGSTSVNQSKTVAVLPFAVMSTGPDDEYFADGLTEEIINALSQLPDLMVTARTSAFHFKGQNIPVGKIADQLGVEHIVEGSVRRAGDQLRITAQLVRAEDGFHLWSETYDRKTAETFAVQEDISVKVAAALNIALHDEQRQRMLQVGVRNVDAFVAYQKGVDLYDQAHRDANQISLLRRANQNFEDAIDLYPTFSDAYIHHSDLYSHILIDRASGKLDGEITKADAEFAPGYLRSDLDNAIRYARSDNQRVVSEFDRALLLGNWRGLKTLSERALQMPGCETALWAQLSAAAFGDGALAKTAYLRNLTCDPLLVRADTHLAYSMLWLEQWDEAQRFTEQRLAVHPNPLLVRILSVALAMQGKFEEARTIIQQGTPEESARLLSLATVAAIEGDDASAADYEAQFIGGFGPDDQLSLRLAAQRGQRNEANRLASLVDRRPFGYIVLIQTIYYCACGMPFDLDAAPIFASMLRESGLAWPPVSPISFPLKDW
jgi:TolB-like protein